MKVVSFSINQHDNDGEIFDHCILIHINNDMVLRFEDLDELYHFWRDLEINIKEIDESFRKGQR